jgi:membrane protease YdiL (CAAX protease family)
MVAYSVFLAVAIAPAFEEIFFRGFCYPIFKVKWGARPAAAVSGLFFSLVHGNPFAILPYFVLGYGLARTYESRGSLVSPVIFHWCHNSLFLAYFFATRPVLG